MGTSPKLATQNTMKLSMLTLIFAVALAVPGSVLGKAQYYRHRQHPLNEAYRILPSLLKAPTTTLSTTVTEVVTTTANVICAELINVTDSCNARNGRWLRIPQIMSFEDGMEDIDRYINPSQPYRIEPTMIPQRYLPEPVIFEPSDGYTPSVYGPGLLSRFLLNQFNKLPVVTVTRVFTESSIEASSVIKTFFISGCTPSPFPFDICSSARSRSENLFWLFS